MNIKQISTRYFMIMQLVFVALVAFLLPFSGAAAAEHCSDEYYVDERLPNGARWDMCWEHRNREGIVFHHIYYTPNKGQRRMVLNQASVAQIHVPYDDNGTRFHDVSDYGIGDLSMLDLTPADCPSGTLLKYSGKNVICKQIENRGFAFKKGNDSIDGNNLVLFSVSPVAAYYYVPLWRFMDNGSIEPWMGATGALQRFGGEEYRGWKLGEGRVGISHLHNFFWKLDFDLNGTPKDDVVEEINFPLVDGKRLRTITTFDTEASRKVNPNTMRRWRVKDKVTKNSNDHAISYDIVLGETGHQDIGPASEPFTHNDFYVTKQNDDEIFASHNPHGGRNLAEFVNGEKLDGSDIVIWTGVTFYHMPRSEDAPHMDAHWSHLQLIPRDWHASNPLGQTKTFNTPPTISPLKKQTAQIGDLVNLSIEATDVDNDILVYSAINLPAGLTLNKKTGVISGSLLSASENAVQIIVSDDEGKSTIDFRWVVEVVFVNTPPQLKSPDNQSGLVGDSINLSIQAKDSDVDNLTYSATGLPQGLVINKDSGVISGSFTSAGNYTISLKVSDGTDTDTKSFIWSVIAPISNEVISQGLQIDGLFEDWADKRYFENDPDDVSGANNQIDWLKAAIAHSPNSVYLTYQNRKKIDPSTTSGSYLPRGWQTYLDTDSNAETGYIIGGMGADYLIDGANVLHYIGTGSSWSWEPKGQVQLAYNGKTSEMSFSRVLIGNPKNIRAVFVGNNAVFNGTHKDRYPDTGFFRYAFTGDSLPNTPPVADGQEISVRSGASVSVILSASDGDNDPLTYKIATPPSHGSLSGSIPNLVYTANTNYTGGEDSFTFKAYDGLTGSKVKTVKVKILSDQTGLIVSNYIKHKITVDGNASDWSEVAQFPDDTDDTSEVINWRNVTFAHNDLSLYLLYKNRKAIDFINQTGSYLTWGWQAYIDSDINKATGFQTGGIGADFIIEGNQVLRYIGNGKNWSWKHVGQAQAQYSGKVAEMALSRSLIGNPVSIHVLFMGNNKAYLGAEVDLYPNKQNDTKADLRYFNYDFSGDAGTDDRPVAFTQTVTVSSGSNTSVNLIAIDPDNDHLTYHVIAPPLHGTLTGVAPNLIYTPEPGFAGQDDLRFNVNDGSSDSATVVVTINVNVTGSLGGVFTNPVSSIAIDGNNEEWNTLASFTDDPDDINEDNSLINWQRATVAHNAESLYFMYKNYGVINPVANSGDYISREWLVYLDADENPATGYKIGNMGADYLIEGSQLLEYTGKGSSWSWKFSAMAIVQYNANISELSIARDLIGNPDKISLVFVGDNRVYGGSVDSYPDNNHFIYQLSEGNQLSTSRPVSDSQVVEVKKNTRYDFTLSSVDQDNDALTYRIIRQPVYGKLLDLKESGSISYKPNADYQGTDSFSYVVNDGTYDSSVVTVSLKVLSIDNGTDTGSSNDNGSAGEENSNSNGSSSGGGGLLPVELIMLFIFIILLRICFVGYQRKYNLFI